jgi:hypothetical protein
MVCYLRKGVKKGSVQLPYVEDVPSVQAFRLREVAAGIFTMGTAAAGASVAAKPPHHVHVDKFWISSTEITRKEFASFVSKTNYSPTSVANGCVSMSSPGSNVPNQDYTWASPGFNQTDAHPVVCVSWTDATAFAKWVDGNVGDAWNCTLPTEAQWEKAAKGTSRGLDKCESNWYEASAAWQSPYAETASPDLASITIKSPENSLKGVEHSVIAVVGVSVVGARSTDIISMEIFCKNCTLGFTHTVGLTFTKNAKDSVSFYGAVSVINNALLGLSYKGDMSFSGVDTLSFKLGAQISVVGVIVQFVNTVPLLSNRNRSVIVHEDTPREFYFLQQPDSQSPMEKYGFVAVSDPDSPSLTIEATVKFGTLSFETMSGSVAQLNEGIINSTFTPALDWNSLYNGPDVVTFSVTDAANNTAITYVDFVVLPVNDLPAIGAPENLWLPEDTIYKFHNTSVVDIDIEESSSAVLEVNVSVGGGTLGLGSSAGLWANDITFSNNRTGISMRGSSLSINAALKSMEYRSFPEFSGQEDIVISATDFGKTGASSGVIVSKTITALILAVNNPPVLSAPTSIEVAEDTQYYINNIVLWDRDSGLDDIEVQLSCSKGVIFVNKTSYYVKTKGLGTDHVVLTGPVAFMADSLLQVSYMGGIDASGKDTIRVVANDLGHSGSGIAHSVEKNIRVSISPVNDPPVITAPASVKGQEDQPVIIEGISFSDADASEALGSFVELHISAIHGSAVPSDTDGIWSTGNGRYRGGIEALTKALSKLLYSPKQDWAGMDTITLVLDDLGNFGAGKNGSANAHIAVEVSPSNDAPTVSLPTSNYSQAIEDTALSITGMAVDDKDFGNGHFKASLVARDGTIAIPAPGSGGVTVTTKNIMILDTSQPPLYGGSFPLRSAFATVVTGPFAEVKIALANVTYKPNLNWYGIDSVEVSVTDDNDLLGKTSFLVKVLPIDDPPSLEFGQTSYNFSQNILSPSLDMTIVDVDSEGVVAVHLYVQKGNLVLQSNSTVGLSLLTNLTSKELMFQGNIESVNSALATIRYQSAFEYVGNDTVITQVKDGENNWEFEQSISIFDFNNAPLIACTNEIVVNENELATIGQFFNLTDVDAGTGAIAVLVSSQQGNLSLDSSSHKGVVVEMESQKISIFGPLPLVNGLLHKVQYVALKYYGGIDSIVVSVNDRGFSGPDGAKQATMTVAVVIEPTNDPPSILTSFGVLTFSENTNTRVEGVTVHDADAGEDFRSLLTVNLTVSHGKLSFLGIPGLFMNEHPQANGQNVLSLQGGLARLNSALGNLKYKGKKEWHGKDILLIMVSDNGNTGSGGAKFASANVTFIVEPLDNAPVLSCPLEQMSLEDTPLLVDFISLHDADAPANALVEVNVSVKIGEISFGSHVGTRVVQNKNIYTISGTHDSVNALLKSGFNFKPAKDFNSRRSGTNDRISITAEDHGGSTVSCATTIVVEPVNDKPVIKFQESPKRASEDTDLKMLGISISDPDANDFQESVLEVNISVGKGTITFAEKGGLSFLSSSEFKGGLKAVQNAISNVVYTPEPEWSGTDTLELTVSDGGKLNGTAFGSLSINVESVQDFPVLACPIETVYGDEDAYAIWISGCSITCPESAISVHQVDVSVTHGTTSLPNITVDTLALHRDLLSNFSYTPARDFCGQDLISISITGGSTIQVYAVTSCTNDVPQIHVPVLFEAMEDVDVVLPGVSVHDSDVNDMVMVHVGTLKGSIVWQSGSGLHRMNGSTYTGNVVDMNHALSNLKYSAPRNWFGTDAIRFTVQDKIGTSSSKEIKMIVHAFNDAPELQIPSSCTIDSLTEIASEDTNHLLRGISVHDVDGDNAKSNITVTLFVDYGNLNVTLVKGDNVIVTSTPTAKNDGRNARTLAAVAWMPNGGNKLVLRGLESGVNKALQHLYYTPSNNFNGMWASPANTSSIRNPNPGGALERMSLKVEDNEGASSEKTCYISVSAINDAPVITAPSSFSTEEDRAVALKGISVEDVDIEEIRGARLEVIIDSTIGTVTVDRHSGLRFFEGTSKGGEKKAPTLEVQNITSWAEKTKEVQQIKVLRSINSSSPLVGSFTIAKHASSWSTRAVFKGYWKCKFQSYGSIGKNRCAQQALATPASQGMFFLSTASVCNVLEPTIALPVSWNGTTSPCPEQVLNPVLSDDKTYIASPPPSNHRSTPIAHDASAATVRIALEGLGMDIESVTRHSIGYPAYGEHAWNVTFSLHAGNHDNLTVAYNALDDDFTNDRQSGTVTIETLRHGNSITHGNRVYGGFKLSYADTNTSTLTFDVSETDMQLALRRLVGDVRVSRSELKFQKGYQWFVTFLNPLGNIPLLHAHHENRFGADANIYVSTSEINAGHAPVLSSGKRLRFQGRIHAINEALATASYRPEIDWAGEAKITLTVKDFGGSSDESDMHTVTHTSVVGITPINDSPIISRPVAVQSVNEDTLTSIPSIAVHDPDIGSKVVAVNVTALGGVLGINPTAGVSISHGSYTKQRFTTNVPIMKHVDEIQVMHCNLTSGSFELHFTPCKTINEKVCDGFKISISHDSSRSELEQSLKKQGVEHVAVTNANSKSDAVCSNSGELTFLTFHNMGDIPMLTADSENVMFSLLANGETSDVQEIQTVRTSVANDNDIQQVNASTKFVLQYAGQSSPEIDQDDSNFASKLSIIAPGVSVSKVSPGVWNVTFPLNHGDVQEFDVVYGTASVHTLQNGVLLDGTFTLKYESKVSLPISYVDSAADFETKVNSILPDSRTVSVTRSTAGPQNEHTWTITFPSEMGDAKLIEGDPNWLNGKNKDVHVEEELRGRTSAVGYFYIKNGKLSTRALPHDISAVGLQQALQDLPGIRAAKVTRQNNVASWNSNPSKQAVTPNKLPSARTLSGHYVQTVSIGDMTKYTNAYVGSEFGRGIPIFGSSHVPDNYILSLRDEMNKLLRVADLSRNEDIRGIFVAQNPFVCVYCNNTAQQAPIHIDICINADRTPKEMLIASVYSLFVDYEIISLKQLFSWTERALTNKYFRSETSVTEACFLNFDACVVRPFLKSSILVWYGFQPFESIQFTTKSSIEELGEELACLFSELTEESSTRRPRCSSFESSKNHGVSITSNIGALCWDATIEWDRVGVSTLLQGVNVVIDEPLHDLRITGLLPDVNAALFSLRYQSRPNWNSQWNGMEQLVISASDGTSIGTETIDINVVPINDAPTFSFDAYELSTKEDAPLRIGTAVLQDVDAAETYGSFLELELKCEYGTLTTKLVPGVLQMGTHLRGAVAPLQDALRSLEYTPKLNWNSDSNAIQEIQSVKISVAPTKEIISIQSRAQRGNIKGSFILLVDQSEYGLGARKTKPVFTNATADDMQLAISGAINCTVLVSRSKADTQGGFVWEVQFTYLPKGRLGNSTAKVIPKVSLYAANLTGVIGGEVIVNVVRSGPNVLSGSFQLGLKGVITEQIPVNASALDVATFLATIDAGVSVSKSSTSDQGVCTWTISFSGYMGDLPLITPLFTKVHGVGADVRVQELQQGFAVKDRLTLTVFDNGNTGAGGNLSASAELYVTVSPDNDEAVIDSEFRKIEVEEDTPFLISGLSINDVDITLSGALHITLAAKHGKVHPPFITGTLMDVAEKIKSTVYTNDYNWNGHDVITITMANGPTKEIPVHVRPVNDVPAITAPISVTTNEDVGVMIENIEVADPDGIILRVKLEASHGIISFNTIARFNCRYIVGGSEGGKLLEVEGSLKSINMILDSLAYVPDTHWSGADTISLEAVDEAGAISNKTYISVSVADINDAALVALPKVNGIPIITVTEDEVSYIRGVSILDVDVDPYATLELEIQLKNGTVSFKSAKGVRYMKKTDTFEGSLDALNHALSGMSYKGNSNFNGYDAIEFSIKELGQLSKINTATLWVRVNAVNDAPSLEVLNPFPELITDQHNIFTNVLKISDVDSDTILLNLTASPGKVSIPSTSGIYSNLTYMFEGSVSTINKGLSRLTYTALPGYSGVVNISVGFSDGESVHTHRFTINANLAPLGPLIIAPISSKVNEDEYVSLDGINVQNRVGYDNTLVHINFGCYEGHIVFTSIDDSVTKNNETSISGLVEDINAALHHLQYSPNLDFHGFDNVYIHAHYQGGNVVSSKHINLQIFSRNDAPKINAIAGTLMITDEDTPVTLSNISFFDAENDVLMLVYSSEFGHVKLPRSFPGVWIINSSACRGLGSALTKLVADNVTIFEPTRNINGLVTFDMSLYDAEWKFDKKTINVNVLPVDDIARIQFPSRTMVVEEDQVLPLTGIKLTDVDALPNDVFLVSFECSNGKIATALANNEGVDISTNGREISIRGILVNVNEAIRLLQYSPDIGYSGIDKIVAIVNELPEDVIRVEIFSVNSAPVIHGPSSVGAVEDVPLIISGFFITDADVQDTEGSAVVLNMTVVNGTLQFDKLQGLHIMSGSNDSPSISLSGSLTRVNYALSKMIFKGVEHHFGHASLQIVVDDLGNTGSGGARTASQTVDVTLLPVDDQPKLYFNGESSKEGMVYEVLGREDVLVLLPPVRVVDVDAVPNKIVTANISLVGMHGSIGSGSSGVAFLAKNSSHISMRGLIKDVNRGLANISYMGSTHFAGIQNLKIEADASVLDLRIVLTAENDPPAVKISGDHVQVYEDTSSVLSGISIVDPDSIMLTLTISATKGNVSLPYSQGISGKISPSNRLEIQGTLDSIDTALRSLEYIGPENYFGADAITIEADDGLANEVVVMPLQILAVNDAPVINPPTAIIETEERRDVVVYQVRGIVFEDVDELYGKNYVVNVSSSSGVVHLGAYDKNVRYLTGDGDSDQFLNLEGLLKDINMAFKPLSYRSTSEVGVADVLKVGITDPNGAWALLKIPIEVAALNSVPTISLKAKQWTMKEGQRLQIPGVSVDDVDVAASTDGFLEATISASHSAALEVQKVSISTVHVNKIQYIDATNMSDGTFSLALGQSTGNATWVHVSCKAVGKTIQEQNIPNYPGHSIGESLESKLREILPAHVEVEIIGVVAKQWYVTFLNAPWNFPTIIVNETKVAVTTITPANSLHGTFQLEYEGKKTAAIAHNASALAVKSRLEELSTISMVSVKRYGPNLNDGYIWYVTFYSPAVGDAKLLNYASSLGTTCHRLTTRAKKCVFPFKYKNKMYHDCLPLTGSEVSSWCPTSLGNDLTFAEGSSTWGQCAPLDCDLASIDISEERRGKGRPEVHALTTFGSHINQIQTITINTSCASCTLEGNYRF